MTENSHSPEPPPKKPQLPVHEWIAVLFIIGFLFFLTLLTVRNGSGEIVVELDGAHYIAEQEFDVRVEGAVVAPQSYSVKRGSLVKDVLALAELLPDADVQSLKMERKVKKGEILHVPCIAMLIVYLEGAVENPGPLLLPKGVRMMDLIPMVCFQGNADIDKLCKKRVLKDGEVIHVGLVRSR